MEELDLNKEEEDDANLLQMFYSVYNPPIFPLNLLSMEILFEIGQYMEESYFVRFLLADRTVSRQPIIRIRLLQLRQKRKILRWRWGSGVIGDAGIVQESCRGRSRSEMNESSYHFNTMIVSTLDPLQKIWDCVTAHMFGTELQEELEWIQQHKQQQESTNSNYDDVMQQLLYWGLLTIGDFWLLTLGVTPMF